MPTLRDSLTYEPVELKFGTSGLRGLVSDMTDLECYINTAGFLAFLSAGAEIQPGVPIYIAGDLRDSTPHITAAVVRAVLDGGYLPVNCGQIPTPAAAFFALQQKAPCVVVTGSHIPANRNGIKFYKSAGEVLKADEVGIKDAVSTIRAELYTQDIAMAAFDAAGKLKVLTNVPAVDNTARDVYTQRYTRVFDNKTLADKKVVFYQHSAVGRDLLAEILQALGAEVVSVGRSEKFVPIDSENVTPKDQAYFHQLAQENPDALAIISTDGDSDRPFVVDERGVFHRGDELGAIVADWLQADFAALPVSSSDAVDAHLTERGIEWTHTKIGSPYVIVAMQEATTGNKQRVVGWEVNGGFLLGADIAINSQILQALPTRDALLPIIGALHAAVAADSTVSAVFAQLPKRFTSGGLIDNFPTDISKKIVATFATDDDATRAELEKFFTPAYGFGKIKLVNMLDGIRIFFENGDIAHLRPSGNAPQLRIYSVADTQERADEIVAMATREPDGIFRTIEKTLQ